MNWNSSARSVKLLVQRGSFAGTSLAVLRSEVGAMGELGASQQLGQLLVADALVDLFDEAEVLVQVAHEAGELGALDAGWQFSPWRTIMPSEARLTMTFSTRARP